MSSHTCHYTLDGSPCLLESDHLGSHCEMPGLALMAAERRVATADATRNAAQQALGQVLYLTKAPSTQALVDGYLAAGRTVCDCHTWPTVKEMHDYVLALERCAACGHSHLEDHPCRAESVTYMGDTPVQEFCDCFGALAAIMGLQKQLEKR